MRNRKTLVLAALAVGLAVAGCASAGRNFVRPSEATLVLGRTSYSEVVERFGPGPKEGTIIKNGQTLRTITYAYARASLAGGAHITGVTPARAIGFCFSGDVLVGYDFTSSFEEDHTDFDETKVAEIKEGKTTRKELEGLLGPPQGRQIHPLIDEKEDAGLVYVYRQWKQGVGAYQKTLTVSVTPVGMVRKVTFSSGGSK